MAKYRVSVDTKGGARIIGEEAEMTQQELEHLDSVMCDVIGAKNGYVSLVEGATGTKFWIPLHDVSLVYLEKIG